MPPDHRTFIRQRAVLMPENTGYNKQSTIENLRYLAHIRYEYLIIFARKNSYLLVS
jgi:hypothetical protein